METGPRAIWGGRGRGVDSLQPDRAGADGRRRRFPAGAVGRRRRTAPRGRAEKTEDGASSRRADRGRPGRSRKRKRRRQRPDAAAESRGGWGLRQREERSET
jgi:hypothetical protein